MVIAGVVYAFTGGINHGFNMMRPGIRMMEPHRFGFFRPGGLIFGGLFLCGLSLLVIVGIVALIDFIIRRNRPAQVTQTAQPAPTIQSASVAEMPAPTRTCSNCGKPAQEDWKTCPYCGNPLT
jgi:hypothetical protein